MKKLLGLLFAVILIFGITGMAMAADTLDKHQEEGGTRCRREGLNAWFRFRGRENPGDRWL